MFGVVEPSYIFNHSKFQSEVDVIAVQNGGRALGWSDKHFGHPRNLLNPGRGVNMGDGWETARHLDRPKVLEPGPDGLMKVSGLDWAVIECGAPSVISRVEVDTAHFKGNFPESFRLEGCSRSGSPPTTFLSSSFKLGPHHALITTFPAFALWPPVVKSRTNAGSECGSGWVL